MMETTPEPQHRRLRLTIAYDGAPWLGWQTLPSRRTVQDELEAAFEKIAGARRRIQGSGRTDAGVHALGQVAHVDVPEGSKLREEDWVRALNAVLPISIRVAAASFVAGDFHSRFDAKAKVYRYRIWRGHVMSPFEAGRAWHVYGNLDLPAMRRCAPSLVGRHNFSRLSANRGDVSEEERCEDAADVTRTLSRVDIEESGDLLVVETEGDGFLYRMVRLMVGSLVHVARGRESGAWFSSLLSDPAGVKSHHMAPPDGLYLVEVKY